MNDCQIIKDIIWSIEDLEHLANYYALEYQRTNQSEFQIKLNEISDYLQKYYDIVDKLESSIELKLYKYLKQGYSPTKAVEKVAEENYLNDIIPSSLPTIWRYYKKLKKIYM